MVQTARVPSFIGAVRLPQAALALFLNARKCLDEAWGELAQLLRVNVGEPAKCAVALGCQLQHHIPAVGGILSPAQETGEFATLAEFNRGMVPETEHLGDVTDGNKSAVGSTGDLQEELVLLWLQTGFRGGLLAELQKTPNFTTEFSQMLNVIAFSGHRQGLRSTLYRNTI